MTADVRAARPEDAAAVLGLLLAEGLEASFHPSEFLVATEGQRVVACGRLKALPDGSHEIASVATAKDARGRGLGSAVVAALLARATGPVHALALAPGFFERHGFRPVERAPEALRAKAEGLCSGSGFVAMTRN